MVWDQRAVRDHLAVRDQLAVQVDPVVRVGPAAAVPPGVRDEPAVRNSSVQLLVQRRAPQATCGAVEGSPTGRRDPPVTDRWRSTKRRTCALLPHAEPACFARSRWNAAWPASCALRPGRARPRPHAASAARARAGWRRRRGRPALCVRSGYVPAADGGRTPPAPPHAVHDRRPCRRRRRDRGRPEPESKRRWHRWRRDRGRQRSVQPAAESRPQRDGPRCTGGGQATTQLRGARSLRPRDAANAGGVTPAVEADGPARRTRSGPTGAALATPAAQ